MFATYTQGFLSKSFKEIDIENAIAELFRDRLPGCDKKAAGDKRSKTLGSLDLTETLEVMLTYVRVSDYHQLKGTLKVLRAHTGEKGEARERCNALLSELQSLDIREDLDIRVEGFMASLSGWSSPPVTPVPKAAVPLDAALLTEMTEGGGNHSPTIRTFASHLKREDGELYTIHLNDHEVIVA